jgi:S-methylmethionine-dependent homocysteine/selenocysteine methylase
MRAVPCMISFTVETDGKLVTGKSLREAIETVDRELTSIPCTIRSTARIQHTLNKLLRWAGPGCSASDASKPTLL